MNGDEWVFTFALGRLDHAAWEEAIIIPLPFMMTMGSAKNCKYRRAISKITLVGLDDNFHLVMTALLPKKSHRSNQHRFEGSISENSCYFSVRGSRQCPIPHLDNSTWPYLGVRG